MSKGKSKHLSKHIHLKCFKCRHNEASYVRHLDWDGLNVQLCLCPECVSLEKERLIAESLDLCTAGPNRLENDRYPSNLL